MKNRFLKFILFALLCSLVAIPFFWPHLQRLYYRLDFETEITAQAVEHHLDPHLVAALIFTESRFRTDARSEAGARGLMQLMPETAAELAREEGLASFDIAHLDQGKLNIQLGTLYLAKLFERFKSEETALAAYNAGPTQVQHWIERGQAIGFPETRAYVDNILRTRKVLKTLYPSWSQPGESRGSRETRRVSPTP